MYDSVETGPLVNVLACEGKQGKVICCFNHHDLLCYMTTQRRRAAIKTYHVIIIKRVGFNVGDSAFYNVHMIRMSQHACQTSSESDDNHYLICCELDFLVCHPLPVFTSYTLSYLHGIYVTTIC